MNILLTDWAEYDKSISGLIPTPKNLTASTIALFRLFITGLRCAFFLGVPLGETLFWLLVTLKLLLIYWKNHQLRDSTALVNINELLWWNISDLSLCLSTIYAIVQKYFCDTVSSILSFNGKTEHLKLASENREREQTRRSISEDGLLADLPLLMAAH